MSEPSQPPVVFDCMTVLQATMSPSGPAAACLRLVEEGAVRLVVSQAVLDEVRDVLSRPKIRQRNPRLTDQAAGDFLARVAALAPPVADVPSHMSYARDPKDEPYLNLAIAEKAAYLVSFDKDLLDLMKPENADGEALRALATGLTVLTPPDFLRAVRASTQAPPAGGPEAEEGP